MGRRGSGHLKYLEAERLCVGGMTVDEATKQVGMAKSNFYTKRSVARKNATPVEFTTLPTKERKQYTKKTKSGYCIIVPMSEVHEFLRGLNA